MKKKVAAPITNRSAAITPEQLGSHLGTPVKTIRAKIRAGHIPHVRGFHKPYLIPISYLISMGYRPEVGGK